jgi:pimeloyl-ACP methyl ester carboxylesterase
MRRLEPRKPRQRPCAAMLSVIGRVLPAVLCAFVMAFVSFAVACDQGGATPTSSDVGAPGGSSQAVSFTTEDGVTLGGHLFGSGSRGVILAHMYPTDQTSWYPTAERLAAEGYLVLTFDFRGYGESGGDKQIEQLDRDVMAAAQEIADAGATEVVLVGASMGGTACLKMAGEIFASMISSVAPPPYEIPAVGVVGVVTLSAPVEFKGLAVADDVPMPVCPLLFMAAEDDIGAEGAAALERLAPNQGDLQIVLGDDHGTGLLVGPESEKVWALLIAFLAENLPGPELPRP